MNSSTPFQTPLGRRHFLQLLGGAAGLGAFSAIIPARARAAGARDPRFVTIILRGALDGLSAVPPVGDPDFQNLRGRLSAADPAPLPLGGFFALHPSLPNFARQYKAGNALIVHAAASPYRDRSHFDGQDVLESGYASAGKVDSGWLNRFLQTLPSGQGVDPRRGLSVGTATPLVIRGPANVLGWAPTNLGLDDPDLPARVLAMYQDGDPALAQVFNDALISNRIASGIDLKVGGNGPGDPQMMVTMATGMAHLLAEDDGPRIAALAFEGWDTHTTEPARLDRQLGGLDGALAAFETTLGPIWNDTAILVITEFGRTAAVNGTMGTDHGTAAAAFLTGGAVKGGRIIADWPGLKPTQLYQARDLAPTTDLRAVAKGVMAGLFDVSPDVLANKVFPDSAGVAPMQGLIV